MIEAQMNAAINEALALMNMHAQRNVKLAVDLVEARTALSERDAELAALRASIATPADK